jgi:hypothetical protein
MGSTSSCRWASRIARGVVREFCRQVAAELDDPAVNVDCAQNHPRRSLAQSGSRLIADAGFAVDVLSERRLTTEQRVAFEAKVHERLAGVSLNWWFAINYYVARRTG